MSTEVEIPILLRRGCMMCHGPIEYRSAEVTGVLPEYLCLNCGNAYNTDGKLGRKGDVRKWEGMVTHRCRVFWSDQLVNEGEWTIYLRPGEDDEIFKREVRYHMAASQCFPASSYSVEIMDA